MTDTERDPFAPMEPDPDADPGIPGSGWTASQFAVIASTNRDGYLGLGDNEYGHPTAVHRCPTCHRPFAISPPQPTGVIVGCEMPDCPTYNPQRDVMRLVREGRATLHREGEESGS